MSSRDSNNLRATAKYPQDRTYFPIEGQSGNHFFNFLVQIKKTIIYNFNISLQNLDWEIFFDSILNIDRLTLSLIKSNKIYINPFYKFVKQLWFLIQHEFDLLKSIYDWDNFLIIYQKLIMHFIGINDYKRMKKCIPLFIIFSEKFEIFKNSYLDFLNLILTGYYENIDEEIVRQCLEFLKIIESQDKKIEINMGHLELSIITWSLMIGEEKCEENIKRLLKLDWDIDEIWYDTIEKLIWKLFKDEKYELALLLDKKLKEAYDIQIKKFTESIKTKK